MNDIAIRERVMEYMNHSDGQWAIYLFALLSASSHGLIHLINSNLFGLSIFNMGLTRRNMINFNLSRLPSGLLCGNVPQLIIQILYVLEFGSENTVVLYAGLTTFVSLFCGILDIITYRNSHVPVRQLMLEEDFTKPYFVIFKSFEIYENRKNLIHRADKIIEAISQSIDVPPNMIEINLCQVVPKGIKLSFIEYSGIKDAAKIVEELNKSIEEGWFQSAVKRQWKLSEEPVIERWDEMQMYEHQQMLTQDFIVNMRTLYNNQYGDDNCLKRACKLMCTCTCCYSCRDTLRVSSMR